mgnify:CR=1 FL=1
MGRIIVSAVLVGILGLGIGYLIFGRIAGEFIPIDQLFRLPGEGIGGAVEGFVQNVTGIKEARQNILISGAVGLAVGAIVGVLRPGARRR